MTPLWEQPRILQQTRLILNSYHHWLGKGLIERSDPRRLFEAEFVVVSHGTQDDPILNYGNAAALALWEMSFEQLTSTPSRLTAEPVQREERARLLARTMQHGYVDDYQGIRISSSGRRFQIHRATVWNLLDEAGQYAGQAATFRDYTLLPDEAR